VRGGPLVDLLDVGRVDAERLQSGPRQVQRVVLSQRSTSSAGRYFAGSVRLCPWWR